MPEFHINSEGEVRGIRWQDLDAFTAGYLEALFFTESDPSVTSDECGADHEFSDGSIPSDAAFGDLHPESLRRALEDCARFQAENAATLESAYERDYSAEQAGRDFWFTRCGHGVGFWDRGLGDAGDVLSEAARRFGDVWVSWGTAVDLPGRFVFAE